MEEDSERYYLKMKADEARNKLPSLPKIINGVEYDTKDLKTRLLGETNIVSAKYVGEREIFDNKDLKQLYRKDDGHYVYYSHVGFYEPIDPEAAHAAMNTTIGYRRFLTDAQKKELIEDDDRIKSGKDSGLR